MRLTQNALRMLLKRDHSVLKKCHVLKVLGGIVLAGALTLGAAGSYAEAASVTKDDVVTGATDITARDGNVTLQKGVNNATGTITATGTPSANAGNINAVNAAGDYQQIIQGAGNSLGLSASGSINSGAMTVNSATAGQNINVTGTLQTVTTDSQGKSTYGDITASGDISAFDASKPAGQQAYDINVGNITAGGAIKGGDITTHGNLTADHVETFKNEDNTLQSTKSNPGTVTVNGAVNLPGNSTTSRRLDIINTVGSHNVLGNVTTGACISIQGNGSEKSTLTGGVLEVRGGSFTIADGIQASIKEVSFNISGRKARIHGGNPNAATILDLDKFIMSRGNILAEASWDSKYAMGAIRSISPDATRPDILIGDGNIAVGANAMLGLGKDATLEGLYDLMKTHTGYEAPTQDGVRSVLALNQPLEIQNGFRVFIDGDLHSPDLKFPSSTTSDTDSPFVTTMLASGTFTQGANTMLVINGDNDQVHYTTDSSAPPSQVTGAISYVKTPTTGDAKIQAGAKLLITGAQTGETYVVLGDGFDKNNIEFVKDPAGADTAWQGANLIADNPLVSLTRGDDGTVAGQARSASLAFPGLDSELVAVIDNANLAHQIGMGEQYYNGGEKGTQFLSRALRMAAGVHSGYGRAAGAATTIESAARMAFIGAAPQMTWATHNAAGTAVSQRTSLAAPGNGLQSMGAYGKAVDDPRTGFALWLMPLYQYWNGHGFDTDASGHLGGVAIGADYTFAEAIRTGVTFNIGGGYAKGSGDFNKTTNHMDFWGIGAYLGWTPDNFGLTADVHYTSTSNDVEQDVPSSMYMDDLKSDITAWAISAGLRGEYKLETSVLDIIPHVGVRYTSLNTDDYNVKSGGTVLKGDSIKQNIWTFPVGVAFSKSIETGNGWRVKPLLDLAVIPAAGDIKAESDVRFTGVPGSVEMKTRTMDYITYMGQAGIEFGSDSLSLGLNYNLQAGSNTTGHGVFGTFRYEF